MGVTGYLGVSLQKKWGASMGQAVRLTYYDNYMPVGDIVTIAICMIMIVLVATSYVKKTRTFSVFISLIICILIAAFADMIQHDWYTYVTDGNYTAVYVFRLIYHIALFSVLIGYVIYIIELMRLEMYRKVPIMITASILYVFMVVLDVIYSVSGKGFTIKADGSYKTGANIFMIGYVCFVSLSLFIMIAYRSKLYKQVLRGFYGTIIIAFMVLCIQSKHGQSSFTVTTFLFPVIGMLYLVHSNPYDMELGSVSARAFEDVIRYNFDKNQDLGTMSLLLTDYDNPNAILPPEVSEAIRKVSADYFTGAVLFQISKGHVLLAAKKSLNKDYENKLDKVLEAFNEYHDRFNLDYKIIIGDSTLEIGVKNEYLDLIRTIQKHIGVNTIHRISKDDVERYKTYKYVLSELADIVRGGNLRDPRVLAYCQPVLNISTGKYDTAEALMRLKLQDTGMVFPDKFIPLAEEYGYIHSLTKIMLQRTCDEIRYLVKENYDVKRISVNVSVLEMRDDNFIADIEKIISDSGIPKEKIAIEITESQNDDDFQITKDKVDRLKDMGIKIYLDDFGTGYSNMERIMELPFDIIKFDRSLVIASSTDNRSEKMVGSLAEMFSGLDYSVLFEGVETEEDEKRCTSQSAAYLQGYKYSKPIPIMDLKNFFSKLEQEDNNA